MTTRGKFIPCDDGFHKGFYNDNNAEESLVEIAYTDYFDSEPCDDFAYGDAHAFLCGSCQLFALCLSKIFGYQAYLIESKDTIHFHVFCRVSKENIVYYIDARGVTTSFDEFMEIARIFVPDAYTIREISTLDIESWNCDEEYLEEALAFAEAIIKGHEENYRV